MKTNAVLFTRILFLLAVVFTGCLVLDFMALHDIRNDYVSQQVMAQYASTASASLPGWTNAPMEWSILKFSFITKLLVTALFFSFLTALIINVRKLKNQAQ